MTILIIIKFKKLFHYIITIIPKTKFLNLHRHKKWWSLNIGKPENLMTLIFGYKNPELRKFMIIKNSKLNFYKIILILIFLKNK